jgi:hypothetical protein
VVLLIVCLLAAVLFLWRCYYVKHHKYNTSQHTAEGEGHEYEEVDRGEGGVAMSDPVYTEVGGGGGGGGGGGEASFHLKNNAAYAVITSNSIHTPQFSSQGGN